MKDQTKQLINEWAEAERAYVMAVIKYRVGSPAEQRALRKMEEARSKALLHANTE